MAAPESLRLRQKTRLELCSEIVALRELILGGEWQRRDDDVTGEVRTYLCVRVADGADLSCLALRKDALEAALRTL